ncbi:methyltransferase domain-containing protein [Microbacterium esteraromaticum]|uniref:class I SAM-dependent methyltransferase n=1 Tax=Microbacterium esteraromaticum TaxID=57043 RepID=UPI001A8F5FE7|nr:class I SAM-dependent methyltransferase [Microbacterium esteraromaticum]MBN8423380.1 methyltransferase domain-containing protein [Microbacterium esteraromaticum]
MQEDIDARIQSFYTSVFDEHARLTTRSAQGPLEYVRTQEIIREHVSAGTMIDIGGGAGVHARALVDAGYVVEVLDPVSRHVEQARALGLYARVGDARELPFSAGSFDATLLLGPLYHLAAYTDRILALREAARVVGPGGFVFAAGLSRYIAFGQATLGRDVPDPYPGEWVSLAAQGKPADGMRFPAGHFHTAEELASEATAAGLDVIEVVGVEGPAGILLESMVDAGEELSQAALAIARAAADRPGVRDMSAHLIAVARVPGGSGD